MIYSQYSGKGLPLGHNVKECLRSFLCRVMLPPVSAAVPAARTAEAPVTKDDMVADLRAGCKPRTDWRLGTEHEKFGFYLKDYKRIDYGTISKIFSALQSRHGWQPMQEGDNVIGLRQNGESITLEPGGQFELSGAPVSNLHQTAEEVGSHLQQVKEIAAELGVGFVGLGFDPKWAVSEIPIMPKGRYQLMKSYMPTVGKVPCQMVPDRRLVACHSVASSFSLYDFARNIYVH